jgi:hypothetical protein
MYTRTIEERRRLQNMIAAVVIPALRQALQDAGEDLVFEVEGFHPDVAYDGHIQEAADEMAALLCTYLGGLMYGENRNLYDAIEPTKVYGWLREHDLVNANG